MPTSTPVLPDLLDALRSSPEFASRLREIEEVENKVAEITPHVMLDVAFSPVILRVGGTLEEAVEVHYQGTDGKYYIKEPYMAVSADDLKVMRARWLYRRDEARRPQIQALLARFSTSQPQ